MPIAKNDNFFKKDSKWMSSQEKYPWDTSIFKIIDNLVIGAGKLQKKNKQQKV